MKTIVGVIQMCSKSDIIENVNAATKYVLECTSKGANMIFLPESFAYITTDISAKPFSESIDGPIITHFKDIAKKQNVWLSLGGFPLIQSSPTPYNSHIIINNSGQIESVYSKLHLFDINLDEQNVHNESKKTTKGDIVPLPIKCPVGLLGLSICYDLRFPELYRRHFKNGATTLAVPAAFFKKTGEAHWEILIRARAIENQCYVISAAQAGAHSPTRSSYGHSMIVDPWGTVLAQLKDEEGFFVHEIDFEKQLVLRKAMPVMQHMRNDLFSI